MFVNLQDFFKKLKRKREKFFFVAFVDGDKEKATKKFFKGKSLKKKDLSFLKTDRVDLTN